MIDVLLGLQWGDEGKGKVVDVLAPKYDVIARFQGGPNAGHTLVINGKTYVLHTIPSGVFHEGVVNVIGNGVVIDPITLCREIETLLAAGLDCRDALRLARKAHLILPTHRNLDAASEAQKGEKRIGSTLRGIGPAYMDRTGRNGLRIGDIEAADFEQRYAALRDKHLRMLEQSGVETELDDETAWLEAIEKVRKLQLVDGEYFIDDYLNKGANILAEGAQGTMLDVDYGTYPFVTSSNTITAGVLIGLGVSHKHIRKVIGISKAYCTRVGSGPFPTELHDAVGERLRKEGNEFGATTGRPRRCGWIDIPALKYATMLNGVDELVLTKTDVLNMFETICIGTGYQKASEITNRQPFELQEGLKPVFEDLKGWNCDIASAQSWTELPDKLHAFVRRIEEELSVPVVMVSTGPGREQLIWPTATVS